MKDTELKRFLEKKVQQYNNSAFIEEDPISIPHRFTKAEDIEIAGFFAALFAWGRRSTILKKANLLMDLMDHAPHDFILQHEETDLKRFLSFVHRTFNATDILFLISFLRKYFEENDSLETAFSQAIEKDALSVESGLNGFYHKVFSGDEFSKRTQKHISAPFKKSACKRLNMFLRWMVRTDKEGVDFGLWKIIKPSQLVIPMDVHVCRVAFRLGLLPQENKVNWKSAISLTAVLREFDATDPVKYDFALFGLGVVEKFN